MYFIYEYVYGETWRPKEGIEFHGVRETAEVAMLVTSHICPLLVVAYMRQLQQEPGLGGLTKGWRRHFHVTLHLRLTPPLP